MSIEVKYVGGSRDGKVRRTRSLSDLDTLERIVWREFDKTTNKPTGRERRENYRLDCDRREYVLQGDIQSNAVS